MERGKVYSGGITSSLLRLKPRLLLSRSKLFDRKLRLSFCESIYHIKHTELVEVLLSVEQEPDTVLNLGVHDRDGEPGLIFHHFQEVFVGNSFGQGVEVKVQLFVFRLQDLVEQFQLYFPLADQLFRYILMLFLELIQL